LRHKRGARQIAMKLFNRYGRRAGTGSTESVPLLAA
jgi:hypothetical protein